MEVACLLGALDEETCAGGIGHHCSRLQCFALGLLGVDLVHLGEQFSGRGILELHRMEFTNTLIRFGIERRDDLFDLSHLRDGRQDDEAFARGFGGDIEQTRGIAARILSGEDTQGQSGQGVGIRLHIKDAEHPLFDGGLTVEFLNDRFGILQISARARDDE